MLLAKGENESSKIQNASLIFQHFASILGEEPPKIYFFGCNYKNGDKFVLLFDGQILSRNAQNAGRGWQL